MHLGSKTAAVIPLIPMHTSAAKSMQSVRSVVFLQSVSIRKFRNEAFAQQRPLFLALAHIVEPKPKHNRPHYEQWEPALLYQVYHPAFLSRLGRHPCPFLVAVLLTGA
ncbi:uncharacterized protein Tco025E_07622 [Trypanosoma conorhini]|uniref:Uncharacterized protein n=1 Tax=Trypanosoma conorhini TaxID=83891 RepID=A0A422NLL0_9TRYP|nr:uncharacterized protein Tco025E_07622 [Trypanosoma conorhini]RNF06249.1 hypothetical protein Tco025E_07622 [Trypanosoma conorhini]